MDKRGQMGLSAVPGVAVTFLLAAVFFALSIIVLSAFETQTVTSYTVTNESVTMPDAVNGTFTLDHYEVTSITKITNGTGVVLGSGNYTIVYASNSSVKLLANTTLCATSQTCLATYVYNSYDANTPVAIQNTIEATAEIPNNWFAILAIIVAISVVIGIVVLAFKNVGLNQDR